MADNPNEEPESGHQPPEKRGDGQNRVTDHVRDAKLIDDPDTEDTEETEKS